MSDENLRKLERKAKQGDRLAVEAALVAKLRAGEAPIAKRVYDGVMAGKRSLPWATPLLKNTTMNQHVVFYNFVDGSSFAEWRDKERFGYRFGWKYMGYWFAQGRP